VLIAFILIAGGRYVLVVNQELKIPFHINIRDNKKEYLQKKNKFFWLRVGEL